MWRLLRRNISVWQTAGYALANFVGLAIVLCAVKFYCDVRSAAEGEDPYVTKDYLVISRSVSGLGSLGSLMGADNSFSPGAIADLESQPWVKRVGAFTSSDFSVGASLDMGGRGMSTALFLESVPEEFFDVKPDGWKFEPGADTTVPIILNKDYLTLYNYGFAASAGLPKVSEGMVWHGAHTPFGERQRQAAVAQGESGRLLFEAQHNSRAAGVYGLGQRRIRRKRL